MGSHNMPAVSPKSGSPTFDTEKKPRKTERGEFITPPRPTGRRSNKLIKTTKEEYFKTKLSNADNSKNSWQAINEPLNKKPKST